MVRPQELIDQSLWYKRRGSGPAMLVMHGGLGLDHTSIAPAFAPLEDLVEVICYDHRGCGRSPDPADWSSVTLDSLADDAEVLRQRLGLTEIIVFGHSFGGAIAQSYARKYPANVAGLVLCGTFPAFDFTSVAMAAAEERASSQQMTALLTAMTGGATNDETFALLAREVLPLYFHRPRTEHFDAFSETRYRAAAFQYTLTHGLPSFSSIAWLHEIRSPTLVLGGDDDWIAPHAETAARLHAGIAGAELAVIAQSGHYPFIEQPSAFNAVMQQWLERFR